MPIQSNSRRDEFEKMFAASDDPWGFRTRWYEERKRDLVLACLPQRRCGAAFEPGCANGELAAALATRCDSLLASDGSPAAVELARTRTASMSHVEVTQAWLPQEWPQRSFDLIVLGELCYYLDSANLSQVISLSRRSLTEDGSLLACHWRHPIDGCSLNGDAVHRMLAAELQMHSIVHHAERDFLIDVWSPLPQSVAERDGLVRNRHSNDSG